jgi:serine/threonine protein kinase
MLTGGSLPFNGKNSSAPGRTSRERIAWEHLNLQVSPPSRVNANIPSAIETVIMTALSKLPDQRFPTAVALRESYDHALTQSARRGDSSGGRSTVIDRLGKVIKPPDSPDKPAVVPRPSRLDQPHLLGLHGEHARQVIPIPAKGLSIGRSKTNALRLREKSVSRQHATVLRSRTGIYIRDEDSSLGTMVNGRKITGPTQLKPGDVIRIGYGQAFEFRAG